MSVKTIPAKTIVTCDCCGRECQTQAAYRLKAKLTIDRGGQDYQGQVVGPGGLSWDCCDLCIIKIEDAIKSLGTA